MKQYYSELQLQLKENKYNKERIYTLNDHSLTL